jgi:hypothetical protein
VKGRQECAVLHRQRRDGAVGIVDPPPLGAPVGSGWKRDGAHQAAHCKATPRYCWISDAVHPSVALTNPLLPPMSSRAHQLPERKLSRWRSLMQWASCARSWPNGCYCKTQGDEPNCNPDASKSPSQTAVWAGSARTAATPPFLGPQLGAGGNGGRSSIAASISPRQAIQLTKSFSTALAAPIYA